MPAYYHQAKIFLRGLAREARDNGGAELLIGLPVMAGSDNKDYYNSVVRVGVDFVEDDDRDDEDEILATEQEEHLSQIYHKSHLVPFGEYIPFKSILGTLLDILQVPMANFSRGAVDQPLLELAGHKVGVSICYEDVFGEEVIRGLPDAKFLVNVSNDAWYGDSLAPHQHLQMARMRAMETARPMLRATNNGISAIIDYRGNIVTSSPQFEVAVLDGQIQPRKGVTLYVLVGNWPVLMRIRAKCCGRRSSVPIRFMLRRLRSTGCSLFRFTKGRCMSSSPPNTVRRSSTRSITTKTRRRMAPNSVLGRLRCAMAGYTCTRRTGSTCIRMMHGRRG